MEVVGTQTMFLMIFFNRALYIEFTESLPRKDCVGSRESACFFL